MNYESVFDRNPKGVRQFLVDRTVGIAGCGGLGSNLAVNLARMGIGKLVLVDFDVIEFSNLNRQHYFIDQLALPKVMALRALLLKINPGLNITTHEFKLFEANLGVFDKCQVVAECFDKADEKAMLINAMLEKEKPVVGVSGLAGTESTEKIKINFKKPNFILIGDEESKAGEEEGLLAARVSVAAAHQAWAVYYLLKGQANETHS